MKGPLWAPFRTVNARYAAPADGTVNGVVFDTTDEGDFINVIADIPDAGTKRFARLAADK